MRAGSDAARAATLAGPVRADDARARLLDAALRVYAQHGYQGSTTRLIAAEAEVNEVTLFRHFGSKDSLLDEAIRRFGEPGDVTRLPAEPRDPVRELAPWFRAEVARVTAARELIRQCFADAGEHPQHVRRASLLLSGAAAELRGYVGRLVKAGLADAPPRQRDAAVMLLLSALVTEALGGDELAAILQRGDEDASPRYARIFLDAIRRD